ncbi:hypothetical protein AVEN_167718-1 [Araneus ventricosus]|uniref:Uncharacterized protein n=1 Tax=Araneus ventricosus TaxID=182803 RepID=A0A4Y2WC88_ARAVE|nr:hypothetical protein AVEN_268819-1 [Araneus ventricosus]GBO33880.1 hypothetical protein AVEN_167718-1 [Araneus ventricosus]
MERGILPKCKLDFHHKEVCPITGDGTYNQPQLNYFSTGEQRISILIRAASHPPTRGSQRILQIQIGSDMSVVQNLQGKFTGKFPSFAFKNSKLTICLRDHGSNVLRKIKFSVKDDTKIRDSI